MKRPEYMQRIRSKPTMKDSRSDLLFVRIPLCDLLQSLPVLRPKGDAIVHHDISMYLEGFLAPARDKAFAVDLRGLS